MGYIYYEIEDYEKAISALNKALEINPNLVISWLELSSLYLDTDEFDKSIEPNKKVLDINPKDECGWNNLGSAYYNIKNSMMRY